MENISRRNFMKGVGAVALATAATGLLSGCGDNGLIVDANGLNDTANLKGVKMTVRKLCYATDSAENYYIIPEILIRNETPTSLPVYPTGGSFEVRLNGSTLLNITDESMARLNNSSDMSKLEKQSLARNQQDKGWICAKGNVSTRFDYVHIIYYPNPDDKKTALRCKISSRDAKPVFLGKA